MPAVANYCYAVAPSNGKTLGPCGGSGVVEEGGLVSAVRACCWESRRRDAAPE
jgi:hypothetical protein